jgi:hypothetical protein
MKISYCLLNVAVKELFDKTKENFLNFSSNNQRCLLQNFLDGKYLLLIRGVCCMRKILKHICSGNLDMNHVYAFPVKLFNFDF